MKAKATMTSRDASRIHSAAYKSPSSKTAVTAFYQRAQSAVAKGKGGWPSTNGNPSGGGRDNNHPKK